MQVYTQKRFWIKKEKDVNSYNKISNIQQPRCLLDRKRQICNTDNHARYKIGNQLLYDTSILEIGKASLLAMKPTCGIQQRKAPEGSVLA